MQIPQILAWDERYVSWIVIEAHCNVGASVRAKQVSTLVRPGRCLVTFAIPACPPCDQKPEVQAVTVASSLLMSARCLVCGGSWLALRDELVYRFAGDCILPPMPVVPYISLGQLSWLNGLRRNVVSTGTYGLHGEE